jgi:hypothetical protein
LSFRFGGLILGATFFVLCCGGDFATISTARSKRCHASGSSWTSLGSLGFFAMTDLEITKLDAAQRQLRTALRLWFCDGDSVSIHTLIAAAHEIIHRLYRNKGLVNLVFDSDLIKDEYRGQVAKKFKEAPSFFKHADRDSDATISFNPEVNDVLPLFLIQALVDMGEPLGLEEVAFTYWLNIHEPQLFMSKEYRIPVDVLKQVEGIKKKQFLKACELLWRHGNLRNLLAPRPPELKGR